MSVVWKYPMPNLGRFGLDVPISAEVAHVAEQYQVPCVWLLVDPDGPIGRKEFLVVGTGEPVNTRIWKHAATFLMQGGSLVWHLFERTE